ncbi:MAG: glycerophosphodiester phosphodiesterase [Gemmatimonadales bacterium]
MILLDPRARPLVAHRGASGEYPENTILAFERGLEHGADAIEFDVRTTGDGVPVVIHDSTVDRTTDGSGAVESLSYEQLCRLDLGACQKIPLLEQVLMRFPEVPMIVEIKNRRAAEPALQVIERCGATERTLIGAFEHGSLEPFRRTNVACSASRRESTAFWLASRLGWSLGGRGYRALTVPVTHRGVPVVDRRLIRSALKRSKPVHVWTVDDRSEAARLRALGVCGIITNFPSRMRDLGAVPTTYTT